MCQSLYGDLFRDVHGSGQSRGEVVKWLTRIANINLDHRLLFSESDIQVSKSGLQHTSTVFQLHTHKMNALESTILPHLQDYPIYMALFTDVTNADFLRQQLLNGNTAFEYAFLDASLVGLIPMTLPCHLPCKTYE